jgi:uncharacterized membrane protein YjfL (UPF0719 family)
MSLVTGITLSLIYGAVGIFLMLAGYFIIDKVLTKIDFNKELLKDNKSVGIVIGCFIIAIAIIVAAAIS